MALQDKVVLITGASRGIGKGIALELGRAGATIVGTATSENGANNITDYLANEGIKGQGFVMDVTNSDSIKLCVSSITETFKAPDVLVNNAGVTADNLFLRMKSEEWDKIIDANLTGVFKVSQACIKAMMKSKWGRIINIGSVVGSTGNPGQVNYCSAKAAIIGFTKSLAREIGSRGITVNTVAPGFIETDMTKALSDEQRVMLKEQIPLGRIGLPADIAKAVLFLATADYITGETLHVNGGMYMA